MSMVADAVAPANPAPPHPVAVWDRNPVLCASEHAALDTLGARFADHQRQWPAGSRAALARLINPVCTVLDWMHAAQVPRNAVVHIVVAETHRLDVACWGWSGEDWLDVLCSSEAAFKDRYGGSSNCRQYVIAVAYLLCGFDRLTEIGRYFQYRLAIKVFGRGAVDHAAKIVFDEMTKVGFSAVDRQHVSNALCMALLVQRSARLEDLTLNALQHVAVRGAAYVRSGAATLSRALVRMRLLDHGLDHRRHDRRRPAGEYRAADDVPAQWLEWCERWRATSVRAASSIAGDYYALLKCGRWMATMHPELGSPADWTRATALEYVATVARMTIGQWSNPGGMYLGKRGCPLKPTAKAAHLRSIRSFFRDLQEWEWIPLRFDPVRALGLPRAIGASIGPNARVVADDAWAKLVWAGLNLADEDLQPAPGHEGCTRQAPRYPIAMVRALAMLWLFAGLRRDEFWRLPVGCIRWQPRAGDVVAAPTCLLDVPVNKTSTAFTKPVDAVVGQAVEVWEQQRLPHPSMPDAKTASLVDYLFVHRGRRVGLAYLNKAVIPLLCRKAGVPLEDARGRITSHRARATIASQLFNAREPLGLFELQAWLGHRSPEATRHYVTVTPTKLAGVIERAGYFARNLRTIAVLVDKDAVSNGSAARGEPWRYYDLGHGLCTYDFFDQCPHRMACAKCSFYVPKDSSKAQALEASANLSRMLQEIPLQEGERAAVEDGIEAMAKLANSLRNTATPDGRTPAELAALGVSGN
jgi:integrase